MISLILAAAICALVWSLVVATSVGEQRARREASRLADSAERLARSRGGRR